MFAFNVVPAAADYLLQPGDTVEITVQGVPELKRRAVIREDGYIPFPLIGNINFANVTLVQARDSIRGILIQRDIVAFPDVTVDLIEVRPLYILGDVARPGSFPFKPEYTIRHAVALAGGLESSQARGRGGLVEAAELAGQFETQRLEAIKQQAKVKRLQAELAGKTTIDFGELASLPDPDPLYGEITSAEQAQLSKQLETAKKDRASYARSIDHASRQLHSLQEQHRIEDLGLQQQTADVDRIRGLSERGLSSNARLTEEQRSILLTKVRLTSTMAQVAQVRRTVEELSRQIDKSEEVRHLEAVKELQAALVAAETSHLKLQIIGEKIGYLALYGQSYLMSGGDHVRFVIYRKVDGNNVQLDAQPGTILMAGDVIEVAIARRALAGTKSVLNEPAQPATR